MDTQRLIQEVQQGNIKSFEKVVETYQSYVYSLCLGIVQDSHIATDITQEVFMKVYVSIRSYKGQGFKTWISRIATNQSIDYVRKIANERKKVISLDYYEEVITNDDTPESIFLANDNKQRLLYICESLDSKYSTVIMKYYFENKTYAQIADEEGISIKTVESRLYRARGMIKRHWKEEGYGALS